MTEILIGAIALRKNNYVSDGRWTWLHQYVMRQGVM